jgi:signal transduction histidine kinase
MASTLFATNSDERVIAGVCAGIAQTLGVDVTLVRLVFALLALAGGAGILLYFALWAWTSGKRPWWSFLLLVLAGSGLLGAVGLPGRAVVGIALVAGGLALVWRRGDVVRARIRLSHLGIALAALGAVILLSGGGTSTGVLAPGAIAGALLLIAGPWLWRLALERDTERAARIRSEERSDVAARVHDSVLQTLALIQRRADDPREVAGLARRQERDLRAWLNEAEPVAGESLAAALRDAAAEAEARHGVPVEVVAVGDAPLDERLTALVAAAREALANAARFSGADRIDVFAEIGEAGAEVFVRDRGAGFDRAAVPEDRRGVRESIEGRMARHGGRARITSAPGDGTEVELVMERGHER